MFVHFFHIIGYPVCSAQVRSNMQVNHIANSKVAWKITCVNNRFRSHWCKNLTICQRFVQNYRYSHMTWQSIANGFSIILGLSNTFIFYLLWQADQKQIKSNLITSLFNRSVHNVPDTSACLTFHIRYTNGSSQKIHFFPWRLGGHK